MKGKGNSLLSLFLKKHLTDVVTSEQPGSGRGSQPQIRAQVPEGEYVKHT